jgi:hypothetical protein
LKTELPNLAKLDAKLGKCRGHEGLQASTDGWVTVEVREATTKERLVIERFMDTATQDPRQLASRSGL